MNLIKTIEQQIQQMPRAFRWLTYAVAFTVLVLVWDYAVRPQINAWNIAADKIQDQAREIRHGATIAEDLSRNRRKMELICALGAVEMPGKENAGSAALNLAVIEVLRSHSGVSIKSFDLSDGGKLPKDVSRALLKSDHRLTRITGDLKFDSSTENAIAVIADLEKQKEIETITTVRIKETGNRNVEVRLTLEAWVLDESKRGRR